jgi:DNA replicative helicase MCM subunit Mcm2 (Cdc46/Mcm family)
LYVHPDKAQQLTKGPMAEAKPKVRIVNHPESTVQIRSMKACAIGRLVTVTGTVVRIGAVRPQITQMDFICNKCSFSSTCLFEEGRYTPPTACPAEGCRSKSFDPLRSSAHSMDWQKIRVQVSSLPCNFSFAGVHAFVSMHTRGFFKISTQQSKSIKVQ